MTGAEQEAAGEDQSELAERYAQIFARALESTGFVQIVEVKAAVGQIHLRGRVKRDDEGVLISRALKPMMSTLNKAFGPQSHFFGKHYFLREKPTGEEESVYAWIFSLGDQRLREVVELACERLEDLAPPRREVTEVPLLGPSTPVGGGPRKGALPVRG